MAEGINVFCCHLTFVLLSSDMMDVFFVIDKLVEKIKISCVCCSSVRRKATHLTTLYMKIKDLRMKEDRRKLIFV